MKKAALVFCVVVSLTVLGLGQSPTVTNSTLQKFQQTRLAADRDYRENYARMGFPSPEELERQREVDMADRIELADQLRTARLERDRLAMEWEKMELESAPPVIHTEESPYYNGYYGGGYGVSSGYYGGYGNEGYNSDRRFWRYGRYGRQDGQRFPYGRYPGNRLGYPRVGTGYRATAVGIYPSIDSGQLRFSTGGGRGGRRR